MTSDLSKTGILLLSHGSRLDQGKKVIEAYTQMYKEEFPEAIVEYGFMEMRELERRVWQNSFVSIQS